MVSKTPLTNKFSADDLHPDIRQTVLRTPRLPWTNRWTLPIAKLLYDIGASTKLREGVSVSQEVHGEIKMLVISPQKLNSQAGILWIHGGGHLAGKPDHLNGIASLVAKQLGITVFIPKYRLAPKHPFPADLEDSYSAWLWLVSNAAKRGIDPEKLAIAGHSAGGGIAAALVQKIFDQGGQQPKAQCLFYPMLDDRVAEDRSLDSMNHFIWNNKANRTAWQAYLAPYKPGAISLPDYAAPGRRDDLSGLPPAWIGQCTLDLFFNEYEHYAQRLIKANVLCEIYKVKGVPHAFEVLKPDAPIAEKFEQSALEFLKQHLGDTSDREDSALSRD